MPITSSAKFANANNDEVQETKEYVEKHRIMDIMQNLTTACILAQPGTASNTAEPKAFMVKQLEMMRTARARSQNHVQFSRENLYALFKCFDGIVF
jgi:hypothetical protein